MGHDRRRPAIQEGGFQTQPPPVVQPVDRAFGLAEDACYLDRRKADDVPEDEDLALLARKCVESFPEIASPLVAEMPAFVVTQVEVLGWNRPPGADVVERGVAGDSQDPGREGDVPWFVLADHRHQLDEDALGYVLGLVVIVDEAAHVTEDI